VIIKFVWLHLWTTLILKLDMLNLPDSSNNDERIYKLNFSKLSIVWLLTTRLGQWYKNRLEHLSNWNILKYLNYICFRTNISSPKTITKNLDPTFWGNIFVQTNLLQHQKLLSIPKMSNWFICYSWMYFWTYFQF